MNSELQSLTLNHQANIVNPGFSTGNLGRNLSNAASIECEFLE